MRTILPAGKYGSVCTRKKGKLSLFLPYIHKEENTHLLWIYEKRIRSLKSSQKKLTLNEDFIEEPMLIEVVNNLLKILLLL